MALYENPQDETEQPVALFAENHNFNGKDADLAEHGQIVIKEAWLFAESIQCVLSCYATICPPDDETKIDAAQIYVADVPFTAEWLDDEWIITAGPYTLDFPTEAEDAEQAIPELEQKIEADERVISFQEEIGSLNRMLDSFYAGVEED